MEKNNCKSKKKIVKKVNNIDITVNNIKKECDQQSGGDINADKVTTKDLCLDSCKINLGQNSQVNGDYGVAIGCDTTTNQGVSLGRNVKSEGVNVLATGENIEVKSNIDKAVFIEGTNIKPGNEIDNYLAVQGNFPQDFIAPRDRLRAELDCFSTRFNNGPRSLNFNNSLDSSKIKIQDLSLDLLDSVQSPPKIYDGFLFSNSSNINVNEFSYLEEHQIGRAIPSQGIPVFDSNITPEDILINQLRFNSDRYENITQLYVGKTFNLVDFDKVRAGDIIQIIPGIFPITRINFIFQNLVDQGDYFEFNVLPQVNQEGIVDIRQDAQIINFTYFCQFETNVLLARNTERFIYDVRTNDQDTVLFELRFNVNTNYSDVTQIFLNQDNYSLASQDDILVIDIDSDRQLIYRINSVFFDNPIVTFNVTLESINFDDNIDLEDKTLIFNVRLITSSSGFKPVGDNVIFANNVTTINALTSRDYKSLENAERASIMQNNVLTGSNINLIINRVNGVPLFPERDGVSLALLGSKNIIQSVEGVLTNTHKISGTMLDSTITDGWRSTINIQNSAIFRCYASSVTGNRIRTEFSEARFGIVQSIVNGGSFATPFSEDPYESFVARNFPDLFENGVDETLDCSQSVVNGVGAIVKGQKSIAQGFKAFVDVDRVVQTQGTPVTRNDRCTEDDTEERTGFNYSCGLPTISSRTYEVFSDTPVTMRIFIPDVDFYLQQVVIFNELSDQPVDISDLLINESNDELVTTSWSNVKSKGFRTLSIDEASNRNYFVDDVIELSLVSSGSALLRFMIVGHALVKPVKTIPDPITSICETFDYPCRDVDDATGFEFLDESDNLRPIFDAEELSGVVIQRPDNIPNVIDPPEGDKLLFIEPRIDLDVGNQFFFCLLPNVTAKEYVHSSRLFIPPKSDWPVVSDLSSFGIFNQLLAKQENALEPFDNSCSSVIFEDVKANNLPTDKVAVFSEGNQFSQFADFGLIDVDKWYEYRLTVRLEDDESLSTGTIQLFDDNGVEIVPLVDGSPQTFTFFWPITPSGIESNTFEGVMFTGVFYEPDETIGPIPVYLDNLKIDVQPLTEIQNLSSTTNDRQTKPAQIVKNKSTTRYNKLSYFKGRSTDINPKLKN